MNTPSVDFRRSHLDIPPKVLEGLDQHVHGVVGFFHRLPTVRLGLEARAGKVARRIAKMRGWANEKLRTYMEEVRTTFRRQGRESADQVEEAIALTALTAERELGLIPHLVQIMGALGLHGGYLLEMSTGEGKSLTAALTAPVAAWTGRPCHVITVNDYLSARDAEKFKQFYDRLGVTVGCTTADTEGDDRRIQHLNGIVYTTSQQLLADFLRDRLKMGQIQHPSIRHIRKLLEPRRRMGESLVLRGLEFALVDEADSVLIDESVTPLIISVAADNRPLIEASTNALAMASLLRQGEHYTMDKRFREIKLRPEGHETIQKAAQGLSGIWQGSPRRTELVTQALIARELYLRDKHYVVEDGKVVIVDEFTGRLMPDRRWGHGLHQAVEVKEQLEMTSPTETMARLSFQRFFRLFRRLCGMSGTVFEAASELWHIYELPVVRIPTHRPCKRIEMPDSIHSDQETKVTAIAEEIRRMHATGRPILVGTRSVRQSDELCARLAAVGIETTVLNATRHKEEAEIVAQAGGMGRITIATNMAGRGTDIHLGRGVSELGGLHVIATERNESRRIDRQLFGRSARQGDPGSSQAFVCPQDELILRFTHPTIRETLETMVKLGIPGSHQLTAATMARAQDKAQILAYRQRTGVLQQDEWLEEALSFTKQRSGL